jgi:hypothetical protein
MPCRCQHVDALMPVLQREVDGRVRRDTPPAAAHVERSPVSLGRQLLRAGLLAPRVALKPLLFLESGQLRLERGQLLQCLKLLSGKG